MAVRAPLSLVILRIRYGELRTVSNQEKTMEGQGGTRIARARRRGQEGGESGCRDRASGVRGDGVRSRVQHARLKRAYGSLARRPHERLPPVRKRQVRGVRCVPVINGGPLTRAARNRHQTKTQCDDAARPFFHSCFSLSRTFQHNYARLYTNLARKDNPWPDHAARTKQEPRVPEGTRGWACGLLITISRRSRT